MTLEEQEAFDLVVRRYEKGASENDIRAAFQRFVETTGLARADDMFTEMRPGEGNPGQVDLYVHNTCFEFKKGSILSYGKPNTKWVEQLDGYIASLLKAGSGVRTGVLTDGVHYVLRQVGKSVPPDKVGSDLRTFDRKEQADRVREYLHGIISRPAAKVAPTAENLSRFFGSGSGLFSACSLLLREAYDAHRHDPTVAVKRRLWQELLQVALGKDAATVSKSSDWLFLRHTYVTSLVAVIMQQRLLGDVARHAEDRPDALLKGHVLAEQSGLYGVIDADLFTWPPEVGEAVYLREIARVVEWFDWEQRAVETAPTLYQNVIAQSERKRLGEYYTPRWLAAEITEQVVDDPLNQRVLDPSCGSGTFIETAVERILARSGGLSAVDRLRMLQENIVGVDLHPVAVQLAKATWVMAAAETIRAATKEQPGFGPVSVPVYLGDSMQLRYDTGTLSAVQSIELTTGEQLPGRAGTVTFSIPKELARRQADVDRIVSEIAAAIDEGRDTRKIADSYPMSDESRRSIKAVASAMKELHAIGRNHVWAYYVRNMIRPAVIADEKVDRIIGNPPWLTYRQSTNIIRKELREMSEKRYRIWAGGKQAPHQDIATLFYTRCAELYAKPRAMLGMVMPHSVLRSGQHLKWRKGDYEGKGRRHSLAFGLDFGVYEPWDVDNVVPGFFPMPAAVVFARYVTAGQGRPLAPGTVQMWRGDWHTNYDGISRTSEVLHHDDGTFKSPYAELAGQGPTIVDRRLFFVETSTNPAMIPAADTVMVTPRLGTQDKIRYETQLYQLEGPLNRNHLFDIYLGECLAPYTALSPLEAALPIDRSTMTMPLDHRHCSEKHNACGLNTGMLDRTMEQRWRRAAALFHEAHKNGVINDLYQNLNHQNKLTRQLQYLQGLLSGKRGVRVAYTTSGRPTAAIISDNRAIIESKAYQVKCRTEHEARYLLAIINSNQLAAAAKPFCTTNWAKRIRDFHKHAWKLPIPRYDLTDPIHARLSELGKTAEQECADIITENNIRTKPPGAAQSTPARRLIRNNWQLISPTARAIETSVAELLTKPTRANLAKQHT